MHRRSRIAIIAFTLLITIAAAFGAGADHPAGPVHNENWPAGLAELVNTRQRMHGYFVNFEDVFSFRGKTDDLNRFLLAAAKLEDSDVRVILHPSTLTVKSPWDEKPRDLVADWQLHGTPFTKEDLDRQRPEGVSLDDLPYRIFIHIWLGGDIALDNLEVPAKLPVTSGGEIEAFIKQHETKREAQ